MKALAMGVYKGNESYIPKDWIKIDEHDSNNGFHGEAFYKNGQVVIAIRGTEITDTGDIKNDIQMASKNLPSQYVDAKEFYNKIKSDFPNQKIGCTGHSLGGSLAQLLGNETGSETVTFNAYGVGNLIPKEDIKNSNIRNYGNVNDTTFCMNLDNQLGQSYMIGYGKNDSGYISKSQNGDYIGGLRIRKYHKIEDMGNLENSVEYKKPDDLNSTVIKANASYDVDSRDIDKKRVITPEEIGEMSSDEFTRNEKFINQQLESGNVMTKAQAEKEVQSGNLIWVNGYSRNGIEVRGYYRRR